MAPLPLRATVTVLFGGLGFASSASTEVKNEFLKSLSNGNLTKSDVELVLAQYEEDLSWSRPYEAIRTVYCKGSNCTNDAIKLPNVGREGHAYLHHIVTNYDHLAAWTVFSQAQRPSLGYFGPESGGGHLLTGSELLDFLAPGGFGGAEGGRDALFLMTSKVHLTSAQHAFRSTFQVEEEIPTPSISERMPTCPEASAEDTWGPYHTVVGLKHFLQQKCSVEEPGFPDALRSFWENYVELPLPANEVVFYVQGARFAVSRERLLTRPKAYYANLLAALSGDSDPCLSYLFEWTWYYLLGYPSTAPCSSTDADALVAERVANSEWARLLMTTGVSGGSSNGGASNGAADKDGEDSLGDGSGSSIINGARGLRLHGLWFGGLLGLAAWAAGACATSF